MLVNLTDRDLADLKEARALLLRLQTSGLGHTEICRWRLWDIEERAGRAESGAPVFQPGKELIKVKRLFRQSVLIHLEKDRGEYASKKFPELRPEVERIKKALKRLREGIRPARRARLLREMRPSDIRALGLTPPPQSNDVEAERGIFTPTEDSLNWCRWCKFAKLSHPSVKGRFVCPNPGY